MKKDCTNCKYGIRWGYFGGRSDTPIMPDDHISGRCRWREVRTDIKFPQDFHEAVLFSLTSPPADKCEAWEKEPFPGSAPRWGERWIDRCIRVSEEADALYKDDLRQRIQKDPEIWRGVAAGFREDGNHNLAEDIERYLPESPEVGGRK